jgi:hypothetical protein
VCRGPTRKSKMSVLVIAAAMSLRCSVRRLFSSLWIHERSVNSRMNISHALANSTGASLLIIRTSSSLFMIFLMRASGSWWFLKSDPVKQRHKLRLESKGLTPGFHFTGSREE